ncbi:MAG: DedA family protein [Actinomycetota bacterium]
MFLTDLINFLSPFMATYGYYLVFFGVALECSAMLGIIIPGETILLLAAFYAAYGELSLTSVILLAIVGAVVGDNIGYFFGRKGGRRFILAYGKYVFITRKRLRAVDRYFKEHGGKTILIARFTSFLRALAAFTAGSLKMPYRVFFWYDFIGAIAWSITISLLGYFLGGNWPFLKKIIERVGYGAIALIVLIMAMVIFLKYWRRNKYVEKNNADD